MPLPWTPWHEVVDIREDLRSGKLTLDAFAADLNDVLLQRGNRRVYEDPEEFFKLTYPTHNLRELTKEVAGRLAGESDKALRQLELTYGGGKTHTLITLYHLFGAAQDLPDVPAVQEFKSHIDRALPATRVAAIPFDYLDTKLGMEVPAPGGPIRKLVEPWSIIAYQLAGEDGLRMLSGSVEGERTEPPATNTLIDILEAPQKEGHATLVLLDEVLMYVQSKVAADRTREDSLINFFQCLTQAATKVDTCCIVASILASDVKVYNQLGKQLERDIATIFRRKQDESVRPVEKQDIAEVLRRRFFTLESTRDKEAFRPHVTAALKGIQEIDEDTKKRGAEAEEQYLKSYPFHPGVTEAFYEKWTNLKGFQRARGVLRIMALGIREAAKWDQSPLVATNAFLSAPGATELSPAASELASIAMQEEYEGQRQNWSGILEGELQRTRAIQEQYAGLEGREVEQALMAIFLHSQPKGHKAPHATVIRLIGHTRPDQIELSRALKDLVRTSWFLDEEYFPESRDRLPREWRLGSKPNLTQLHHEARSRVEDLVEPRLRDEIAKCKSLTRDANGAGARVHALPSKPGDIKDDGAFHYGVLGPEAASQPGQPSDVATRYLFETTTEDRPRVNKNAVVLAVPTPTGLDQARTSIRDYLAWEEVGNMLKEQDTDPLRDQRLSTNKKATKEKIAEAVKGAYTVAVTVGRDGEAEAIKVPAADTSLFKQIKNHDGLRIKDSAVTPESLLPGGPYDLWRDEEEWRHVVHIAEAFAQQPALPKMLRPEAVYDTVKLGCQQGTFVLRLKRPDGSFRTWWRQRPDDAILTDRALQAVRPEAAELSEVSTNLLQPGVLPALWENDELLLSDLYTYFSGDHVVHVERDGFEEPVVIPAASEDVLHEAVRAAVTQGYVWLRARKASLLSEEVPEGILAPEATLRTPPQALSPSEILPQNLPEAWEDEETTAAAIDEALTKKHDEPLPWATVQKVIDGAFTVSYFKRTVDSARWPTDRAGADQIKIKLPTDDSREGKRTRERRPVPAEDARDIRFTEASLEVEEIQNLADEIGELVRIGAGYDLQFSLRIEVDGEEPLPEDVAARLNEVLDRVSGKLGL